MSGIALIAGVRDARRAVGSMVDAAPHRGTDVSIVEGSSSAVAVQHQGYDTSFTGAGVWADDRILVAFAGCLYRSDSVIPAADAARTMGEAIVLQGPGVFARFLGSFACGVILRDPQRVFLARSAVGEQPLFMRRHAGSIAAASEVKQVLAAPLPRPAVDRESMLDFVAYDLASHDRIEATAYAGVNRVRPGSWVEIDGADMRATRFWFPEKIIGTWDGSFPSAVDRFRDGLARAVSRRIQRGSGLLLSGGMDSSSIAATAAPMHAARFGSPLQVVSAAYPNAPAVDEAYLVRLTQERLGCQVTWLHPEPRQMEDLTTRTRLHDGPDPHPFTSNLAVMLRGARAAGIVDLMDGHDGDAAFGSAGASFHEIMRRGNLVVLRRMVQRARERTGWSAATAMRRLIVPALADFAPILRRLYRAVRPAQLADIPSWVQEPLRSRLREPGPRDWARFHAVIVAGPLLKLLEHLDREAAASGVSLTHPLSDPELLDFLLSIPAHVRLVGGDPKSLPRAAFPVLPPEVTRRFQKTMFNDAVLAGAPASAMVEAVQVGPQAMEGIDWSLLESALMSGELGFPEWALAYKVLAVDRFLGIA